MSLLTSTAGLVSSAGLSQYSATKHALKALADILREEVNPHGVRVLSVYLGRTATPMQAGIRQTEGKSYRPDQLIQPNQVASRGHCCANDWTRSRDYGCTDTTNPETPPLILDECDGPK